MKNRLKNLVYNIIKNNNGLTKGEIKSKLYDLVIKNKNVPTKEFFIAYGDIGWVFQTLRQEDELVGYKKIGRNYFWYAY